MLRSLFITTSLSLLFLPLLWWGVALVTAEVMSSSNFQIDSDSLNIGGGLATSSNFGLESTVGEIATGDSASANFEMRAGFQQMQSVQISMTQPDPVSMNPSIPGVAGGFSFGSTTVTVTTDSPGGYQIQIAALETPALQANDSAATIADYIPSGGSDFTFTVGASDALFGYTVESAHAIARFRNNTTVCGVGSNNTGNNCWVGLSLTPTTIVSHGAANHPLGTDTTIHFQVGVGGSVIQTPGVYTATTTLTALPL